jgi:hypothetical protein
VHDDIRQLGQGRYSVWRSFLRMAASDDSNPSSNGRRYELRCGDDRATVAGMEPDSVSARNVALAYDEYRFEVCFATAAQRTFIT